MKVKVIIEETISQEFIVDIKVSEDSHDQIKKLYDSGDLVLDNANLIETKYLLVDDQGNTTDDFINIY